MACKNGSKSKHLRKFWFSFNAISYNSVRGVGRMKQLHTGVTLPQCIAGAGSWRKQMKDVRIMKTVQMLVSVIEDFVVIAVESKIGLFLLNNRSMFLGSVQPYCKGYICLF